MYKGTFQLRFNHDRNYGPDSILKPDWVGCDHSDDIALTFGAPFATYGFVATGLKFTPRERELSGAMMRYFTNFAKTG